MKWLPGRGPLPERITTDDLPLDQRERMRLLKFYSGNLEAAIIAWSNHTHFQYGRFLFETGHIGELVL